MAIWDWFNGKKTWICATLLGLLVMAQTMGWVDDETAGKLRSLIEALTALALRHAISKT